MATAADRLDEFQRTHPVVGLPLAVVYKYFDDQGPYLAAILTYYAFVSIFPLLLIASSILGFVLQGNAQLRNEILTSALSQFPIVGSQLGRPEGLQGSASAIVVGFVTALYGMLGLGQAGQNAMCVVWAVPRNSRFNPLLGRLRSLGLLALGGVTVLFVAVITSLGSNVAVFGAGIDSGMQWAARAGSLAVNALAITLLMRLSTPGHPSYRSTLPGGIAVAVLWQLLQLVGGAYASHVIAKASQMNGTFALVLGLVGLLFIAAVMAVLGAEINVVLAKRLYPRALLTPFTDDVELTDADRRAYAAYAKAQRHKGFERVLVFFDPRRHEAVEEVEHQGEDAGAVDEPTVPPPTRRSRAAREPVEVEARD